MIIPRVPMKTFKNHIDSLLGSTLDILFPPLCSACGKNIGEKGTVCDACLSSVPLNGSFFCGKCGARLPNGEKICHFEHPYILGAAAEYRNAIVRSMVHDLKFGFIRNSAPQLAELMADYLKNTGFAVKDWLVIPIPLGKKRLRKRGFNQAELLANVFADSLSLTTENGVLFRKKETSPQSEIKDFSLRAENTEDCFEIAASEKISGRNIIIIDDVSTSGATFFEAASSLKKAGARRIIALAAAKG